MPDIYLNNVVTTLREGLLPTDTVMKVKVGDGAKFVLAEGEYMYVTLRDRTTYEVVKVAAIVYGDPDALLNQLDDLIIQRGEDDTVAKQFPVGTCVCVEWNWAQFRDIANQIAEQHEPTIEGTPPIVVTHPEQLLWNVAIDNSAFLVVTGVIDPVDAPEEGVPPLYVNTVSGAVWLWNGTAWQHINVTTDVSGFAPLNSPIFTGDPRGPTPAPGDNDTSLATTAYVTAADAALAVIVAANLAAAVAILNGLITTAGTLQNVSATSPIASTGGANPVISHNNSGAAAGNYEKVVVDVKGHVTGGNIVGSPGSGSSYAGIVKFVGITDVLDGATLLPPGWSAAYASGNNWTITHNLGTVNYVVYAEDNTTKLQKAILNKTANTFDYDVELSRDDFNFIVVVA